MPGEGIFSGNPGCVQGPDHSLVSLRSLSFPDLSRILSRLSRVNGMIRPAIAVLQKDCAVSGLFCRVVSPLPDLLAPHRVIEALVPEEILV